MINSQFIFATCSKTNHATKRKPSLLYIKYYSYIKIKCTRLKLHETCNICCTNSNTNKNDYLHEAL